MEKGYAGYKLWETIGKSRKTLQKYVDKERALWNGQA
jgi:hypothetical protein